MIIIPTSHDALADIGQRVDIDPRVDRKVGDCARSAELHEVIHAIQAKRLSGNARCIRRTILQSPRVSTNYVSRISVGLPIIHGSSQDVRTGDLNATTSISTNDVASGRHSSTDDVIDGSTIQDNPAGIRSRGDAVGQNAHKVSGNQRGFRTRQ